MSNQGCLHGHFPNISQSKSDFLKLQPAVVEIQDIKSAKIPEGKLTGDI